MATVSACETFDEAGGQARAARPGLREDWTQNAVSSGVFAMKSFGVSVGSRNLSVAAGGSAA